MPDVIMVASWRVMTVSSVAFTRLKSVMSALSADFFSAQLHDLQALGLKLLGDGVLGRPLSSPFDGTPIPSTAL